MKSLTYLSIVFTLVILYSCKSESFTTQRYTNFGHSHRKHTAVQTPALARQQEMRVPVLTQAVPDQQEVSGSESFAQNRVSENRELAAVVHTDKKASLLHKAQAANFLKREIKKLNEQNLKPAKTFKEKVQRTAGLFNTLFEIVLFAIILAILVAVVIIIIIL